MAWNSIGSLKGPQGDPGTSTTDASLLTSGTIAAARLPRVLGAPNAQTVAATVTMDASVSSIHNVQSTDTTLAVAVPTNPTDRQVLRCAFKKSTAAALTVNLNASIRLSTGLASRSFSLASGEVLLCALEYSTLVGAWVLTAATTVPAS